MAVVYVRTEPRFARVVRYVALAIGLLCVLAGAADLTTRAAEATLGADAGLTIFGPAAALGERNAALAPATSTTGMLVPARLQIPSLGVNAAVEQVGKKADGTMGTPQDFDDVAWYALGSKPGLPGNAVFAGHVNNGLTTSGVFANLSKIKAGEYITLLDADGRAKVYKVTDTATYPANEAPAESIFATTGPEQLVLITCDGEWVQSERTYERRLVVFAKPAY